MACYNSALGTEIETPQAGLTIVSPVRPLGFLVLQTLHDKSAGRTTFSAGSAAGAVIVGVKDLPHEKTAHYQVEYREQWDEVKKGNRPGDFIEVVACEPERFFPEKEFEIPIGFAFGPCYDLLGMLCCQSGVNESHIDRHVKANRTFGPVSLKHKNHSWKEGRRSCCPRNEKRPDV